MSTLRLSAVYRLLTRWNGRCPSPSADHIAGALAPPGEAPCRPGFTRLTAVPTPFGPAWLPQTWAGVSVTGYFAGDPALWPLRRPCPGMHGWPQDRRGLPHMRDQL